MHSQRTFRLLLAALSLAFAAGCGATGNTMQPQVADVGVPAQVAAETSCAGDLCFTYANANNVD